MWPFLLASQRVRNNTQRANARERKKWARYGWGRRMTKEKVTLNCTPSREENEFPLRKSYYVQRKSFVVSFFHESSGDIYLDHSLESIVEVITSNVAFFEVEHTGTCVVETNREFPRRIRRIQIGNYRLCLFWDFLTLSVPISFLVRVINIFENLWLCKRRNYLIRLSPKEYVSYSIVFIVPFILLLIFPFFFSCPASSLPLNHSRFTTVVFLFFLAQWSFSMYFRSGRIPSGIRQMIISCPEQHQTHALVRSWVKCEK